jgi:putative long chain acyl-CoA synthase
MTGDLFRKDADGDYWRVDNLADVVRTAAGPVFTGPIRDALGDLAAVDLAVAYGVSPNGEDEVAVAAVTLVPGEELSAQQVARALDVLPASERPTVVHIVDEIPVTTWFRPLTGPLRDAGIPAPQNGRVVWYRDAGDRYRPLTEAARKRLVGSAA